MALQSAVAYSEAKDVGLLVSWQLIKRVLVWLVPYSLSVKNGFLLVTDKRFGFSVRRREIFAIPPTAWVCSQRNGV